MKLHSTHYICISCLVNNSPANIRHYFSQQHMYKNSSCWVTVSILKLSLKTSNVLHQACDPFFFTLNAWDHFLNEGHPATCCDNSSPLIACPSSCQVENLWFCELMEVLKIPQGIKGGWPVGRTEGIKDWSDLFTSHLMSIIPLIMICCCCCCC